MQTTLTREKSKKTPAVLKKLDEKTQQDILTTKKKVDDQETDLKKGFLQSFASRAAKKSKQVDTHLKKEAMAAEERDSNAAQSKQHFSQENIKTALAYHESTLQNQNRHTEAALSQFANSASDHQQNLHLKNSSTANTQLERDQDAALSDSNHQTDQMESALNTTQTQQDLQSMHQSSALNAFTQSAMDQSHTTYQRQKNDQEEVQQIDQARQKQDEQYKHDQNQRAVRTHFQTANLKAQQQKQTLEDFLESAQQQNQRKNALSQAEQKIQTKTDQNKKDLKTNHDANQLQQMAQQNQHKRNQQESTAEHLLSAHSKAGSTAQQTQNLRSNIEKNHQLTIDTKSQNRDLKHQDDEQQRLADSQQRHHDHHQALSSAQLNHYSHSLFGTNIHASQAEEDKKTTLLQQQAQTEQSQSTHKKNITSQQLSRAKDRTEHHEAATQANLYSYQKNMVNLNLSDSQQLTNTQETLTHRDQLSLTMQSNHQQQVLEAKLSRSEEAVQHQADSVAYTLHTLSQTNQDKTNANARLLERRKQANQDADLASQEIDQHKADSHTQLQLSSAKHQEEVNNFNAAHQLNHYADSAIRHTIAQQNEITKNENLATMRDTKSKKREETHRQDSHLRQESQTHQKITTHEAHTTDQLNHFSNTAHKLTQQQSDRALLDSKRQWERDHQIYQISKERDEKTLNLSQKKSTEVLDHHDAKISDQLNHYETGSQQLHQLFVNHQKTTQDAHYRQDQQAKTAAEKYFAEKNRILQTKADQEEQRLADIESENNLYHNAPKKGAILWGRWIKNRLALAVQGVADKVRARRSQLKNYFNYKLGQASRDVSNFAQDNYEEASHVVSKTTLPLWTSATQKAAAIYHQYREKLTRFSHQIASGWNQFWSSARLLGVGTQATLVDAGVGVKNRVADAAHQMGHSAQHLMNAAEEKATPVLQKAAHQIQKTASKGKKALQTAAADAGQMTADTLRKTGDVAQRQMIQLNNGMTHATTQATYGSKNIWIFIAANASRFANRVKNAGTIAVDETVYGIVFVAHHLMKKTDEALTDLKHDVRHSVAVLSRQGKQAIQAAAEPLSEAWKHSTHTVAKSAKVIAHAAQDTATHVIQAGKNTGILVYETTANALRQTTQWTQKEIVNPIKHFSADTGETVRYRGQEIRNSIIFQTQNAGLGIHYAAQQVNDYIMQVGGQQFIRIHFMGDQVQIAYQDLTAYAYNNASYTAQNVSDAAGEMAHAIGTHLAESASDLSQDLSRRAHHAGALISDTVSQVRDDITNTVDNNRATIAFNLNSGWEEITATTIISGQQIASVIEDQAQGLTSAIVRPAHQAQHQLQLAWHQTSSHISSHLNELGHQLNHEATSAAESITNGLQTLARGASDAASDIQHSAQRAAPAVIYPAQSRLLILSAAVDQTAQKVAHQTTQAAIEASQTFADNAAAAYTLLIAIPAQDATSAAQNAGRQMAHHAYQTGTSIFYHTQSLLQRSQQTAGELTHETGAILENAMTGAQYRIQNSVTNFQDLSQGASNNAARVSFWWNTLGDRELLESYGLTDRSSANAMK